jgi:predicted phage terminase large subunit-like protein
MEQPDKDAADLPQGLLDWMVQMMPHYTSRPFSKMHHWLGEWLDAAQDVPEAPPAVEPGTSSGDLASDDAADGAASDDVDAPLARGWRLNVLGPRGSAKSTVVTLAYVLREVLEGREPYVWIVSETKHQAHGHLESIKLELLDNPNLRERYQKGVDKGSVWTVARLRLNNDALIEAFGAGQPLRGRRNRQHRPSLIVCDDLQGETHGESPRRRDVTRRWFRGTLLKAGDRRTNVINLATALHREALALELCRTAGWRAQVFRAIERWPDNMPLWAEWQQLLSQHDNPHAMRDAQRFFDLHRQQLLSGAVLLWPEGEDLLTLMKLRAESGTAAFEREKQNHPAGPESCEFPEAYFPDEIWFDDWPSGLAARAMALDPSTGGDGRHGDYSAFVMLGIDGNNMLYARADLARRPTPRIVEDGVELYRRFRPDVFVVESNQFQHLLAGQFRAAFDARGMVDAVVAGLVNDTKKEIRIRRLGTHLSRRRLRFKSGCAATRMLVDQLRDFPTGAHDDGPDALEMALRALGQMLEGRAYDDGLGTNMIGI